jgi:hypothetical protein
MDLKKLQEPLSISDIDFRIQSINKGGYATILAYKDARVDINRLNDVCGHLGWKREHTRDNHNCIVSIWDADNKHWVSKEDTGTESNTEAQKGLASDSFKRACFNWGIGIELYDYPAIQVKLNSNEFELKNDKAAATFNLKLKQWVWSSKFENNELVYLSAKDNNGVERFSYTKGKSDEDSFSLALALDETARTKTLQELQKVWETFPDLQKDVKFKNAVNKRKAELK